MSNINEKLGKRVREIRKAKKMSQEELAYQAEIDYSYLNEIEAGKRNPSVKRIAAIAKALRVSIKDLFE
jgi:transcriptional regulator with XRE-family HTH domain